MNSLVVVVDLILAIFLERRPRKNSRKSSLPSSQTDKDETASSKRIDNGKGRKVAGEISNARIKETITVAEAKTCDVCGVSLDEVPCRIYERRTKIDIVFEKTDDHVDGGVFSCTPRTATIARLAGTLASSLGSCLQTEVAPYFRSTRSI